MKAKKPGKNSKKASSTPSKTLKPVDLGAVRERIAKLVGNNAMHMVHTTIKEVDKGHYLAMKYLFEMIGLCPASPGEEAPQDDTLARTLLRRLQLPEEEASVAEITKDCATQTAEPASDAIK